MLEQAANLCASPDERDRILAKLSSARTIDVEAEEAEDQDRY